MARRLFFVEEIHSGHAVIEGDEAHHLTRVLRVEAGQRYEISDNQALYLAEVEAARKSQVSFRVLERLSATEPPVRMELFAALIKFDHFEWMLEKTTELGVHEITPVIAERSEKGLGHAAEKRSERWNRILKESAQQSRRWQLPVLNDAIAFKALPKDDGFRYMLEEQSGATPILSALPAERNASDAVKILVGPEGGWTEVERIHAKESDWCAVSLGPTVLRAETAATAALAVISAAWHR